MNSTQYQKRTLKRMWLQITKPDLQHRKLSIMQLYWGGLWYFYTCSYMRFPGAQASNNKLFYLSMWYQPLAKNLQVQKLWATYGLWPQPNSQWLYSPIKKLTPRFVDLNIKMVRNKSSLTNRFTYWRRARNRDSLSAPRRLDWVAWWLARVDADERELAQRDVGEDWDRTECTDKVCPTVLLFRFRGREVPYKVLKGKLLLKRWQKDLEKDTDRKKYNDQQTKHNT